MSNTKLLMAGGGVLANRQNDPDSAKYWASLGLQGFLLNYIVTDWNKNVGGAPNGTWEFVKKFQDTYSAVGITDNYIKIAAYATHDWSNKTQNEAMVTNFSHAAALAKYAGMLGIALDLEPYVQVWTASATQTAMEVKAMGQRVAMAMHSAFPNMTLVLLPDVVYEASIKGLIGEHYALSVPFVHSLLSSVPWKRVIIAIEQTYSLGVPSIPHAVSTIAPRYPFSRTPIQVAPGIWPLGLSSIDKDARMTPEEFEQRLATMYALKPPYAWIFGYGSAWQTDGPYGAGPVVSNFDQYIQAIQTVKAQNP